MTQCVANDRVREPLLEFFRIEGLNDYKTITLTLERNIKIISAENGSGKTTLLNALYALLTGKLGALLSINFSRFVIKFSGRPEISARKSDLFPQLTPEFTKQISSLPVWREARMYRLTEAEVQEMILLCAIGADEDFESCSGYRKLFEDTPYDRDEIKSLCERAIPETVVAGQLDAIQNQIQDAMGGVSVLYLPTFRRIEADLPEYRRRSPMRTRKSKDDWDSNRLIYFGLEDVDRRLKSITSDIRKGTFEAYSRISARTLDQLLAAGTSTTELKPDTVDVATLKVVLARLGKTNSDAEVRIIDLITSGRINDPEHESLRSFLGQLLEIYQEKRDYEQSIEAFVKVVDSYWDQPGSEKRYTFDKLTVEAKVENTFTKLSLPLGALSSGEKQIVSVFARLYLDAGKRYLILIDEPELSLSMEWQQKFLPDVLSAPSCEQLIAITHSPFTFDNELDPYAGPLDISYIQKSET